MSFHTFSPFGGLSRRKTGSPPPKQDVFFAAKNSSYGRFYHVKRILLGEVKLVRYSESKMCFLRCKTLPTVEFSALKRILLGEAKTGSPPPKQDVFRTIVKLILGSSFLGSTNLARRG
jgi:hypothetical protein